MKWNKLIQNDQLTNRDQSPIERFNTSRSRLSQKNSANQLTLKSCQKIKQQAPVSLMKKITTVGQQYNYNEFSSKKLISKHSSSSRSEIDKLNKLDMPCDKLSAFSFNQLDQACKIMDYFIMELEDLVRNCFNKFEQLNIRESKDDLSKKITKAMEEVLQKCLLPEPLLIKAQTNFTLGNYGSRSQLKLDRNLFSSPDKKKTRVVKFKNQKVTQKNAFNKIQNSVGQLTKLLEIQKQPRFIRSSKVSRKDRSNDSVEMLLENNITEQQNSYINKLKAKQTLYKFNKILQQ